MEWHKSKEYSTRDCSVYYTTETFNSCAYYLFVTIIETDKSIKYFIAASSGKKKKHREIFEAKDTKSQGGIKALFWMKKCIFDFPEYYKMRAENKKQYICINWADNRRRNIYARLINHGFQFMIVEGTKTLIKKL